jgi:hypothetical protein
MIAPQVENAVMNVLLAFAVEDFERCLMRQEGNNRRTNQSAGSESAAR